MTFTPADFTIGESGVWFFSLMWEYGKDNGGRGKPVRSVRLDVFAYA